MRRFAPHTLSEPEERMLAERGPAAASAWHTLFGQITSTLEVPFDAGEGDGVEPHTIDRLLAHVRNPDRDLRKHALEALYDGLEPHTDTLGARLRHAGRRPPGDGQAARLRRPDGPDAPSQRAARRGRRGDDGRRRGPLPPRPPLVPGQGGHPRPRPPGAARPVRADRRGPRGGVPRGDAPHRRVVRALLPARRRDRRRLLRRAPHRRRAAHRQARRAPSARRSPRTPRRTSS